MVREFLFASSNAGKLAEFKAVANEFGVLVKAPNDIGQDPPQVKEGENSYEENALIKARAFCEWSGCLSVADDAGLEVKALSGAPGVISARYAGAGASDADNRRKLLAAMRHSDDRAARFVCILAAVAPNKTPVLAHGVLNGQIAKTEEGRGGFGYDSIFVVDGLGETLATLKERGVALTTHRIAALRRLLPKLFC